MLHEVIDLLLCELVARVVCHCVSALGISAVVCVASRLMPFPPDLQRKYSDADKARSDVCSYFACLLARWTNVMLYDSEIQRD